MAFKSKRYKEVKKLVDSSKYYDVKEAIGIIRKSKKLKFDETIDIAVNLGVDPKHADQIVKGVVKLPHGNGKKEKIAVFAKDDKASFRTQRINAQSKVRDSYDRYKENH